MDIQSLKDVVAKYQSSLEQKTKSLVSFDKSGPVGMSVIYALLAVVERQDERIAQLEEKLKALSQS